MGTAKKNRRVYIIYIVFLIAVVAVILGDRLYRNRKRPETLQGIWQVQAGNRPCLLTFTSKYIAGRHSKTYNYIRLIDMETGAILHSYKARINGFTTLQLQCLTENSLWLKRNKGYVCLRYPLLEERWNDRELKAYIEKTWPAASTIYRLQLEADTFKVTNTAGKEFTYSVDELEPAGAKNNRPPFNPDDINSFGRTQYYPIPAATGGGVEITVENNQPQQLPPGATVVQRLQADEGFAANYAAFTPQGHCLLFDGNRLRTMKRLLPDSNGLVWQPLFKSREWLEADVLRPYKKYRQLPENRLLIANGPQVFVHYQTSLDKKQNTSRLAAVNHVAETVLWDAALDMAKIDNSFLPERTVLLNNLLVTCWLNGSSNYIITCFNGATGKLVWYMKK